MRFAAAAAEHSSMTWPMMAAKLVWARCSSILPLLMRATSSRSSTSRVRWVTWRSTTSLTLLHRRLVRIHMGEHAHRGADRRQRVAQFVAEAGQEFILAAVGLAHLVLLVARAQHRLQRRDQGEGAHRAFEQGDVAEHADGLAHAERIGAAIGQQHDRHVRPAGLRLDEFADRFQAAVRQRFFHRQHGADAERAVARPVRAALAVTRLSTCARVSILEASTASWPDGA